MSHLPCLQGLVLIYWCHDLWRLASTVEPGAGGKSSEIHAKIFMMHFASDRHHETFEAVLSSLRGLGYEGSLLQREYQFPDWFAADNPGRKVPAAAFARHPTSYDSACFAVLVPNGKAGSDLVLDVRALGAPIALEVRDHDVIQWKVGRTLSDIREVGRFPASALTGVFEEHRDEWSSEALLRAKGILPQPGDYQLDFVDLGLIPALEGEIQTKLDRLLQNVLADAGTGYRDRYGRDPDYHKLYRLVFRCLAAKVFHDRDVPAFSVPLEPAQVRTILDEVADYYTEEPTTVLRDARTQTLVAEHLWTGVDFRNLSADVLAYIYEKTLVTPQARKQRGIHRTPYRLARYVVHHLPFEEVARQQRLVVEPCCGHGVFLLAALQRLRDLLPPDLSDRKRHRYLVKMLRGYDVDPFALEVGHLSLLLADFPNKDGWSLKQADVYRSKEFIKALGDARFVVCNPPFEDFSDDERLDAHQSVHKPVALVKRVLDHLHPEGMLGFVLPRKLLDGAGYRDVRRDLATRFRSLEVVALPDNLFEEAAHESALLIATEPREGARTTLRYSRVNRNDSRRFLDFYRTSSNAEDTITPEAAAGSLIVSPLLSLWRHLRAFPVLGSAVEEMHRGIEWRSSVPEEERVRDRPAAEYEPGIEKASGRLAYAFTCPEPRYLLARKAAIEGDRDEYPWSFPKVAMNRARASSGVWCIRAFADHDGLITSQQFHNLWPAGYWTANGLAAVLNGPVANLYLAERENKRDLHASKIKAIPLPQLSYEEIDRLDRLVAEYVHESTSAMPVSAQAYARLHARLLEIDAIVLAGYRLTRALLDELLDTVGSDRRPVPFEFTYPPGFTDRVMIKAPEEIAPSPAYEIPAPLLREYHALFDKSFDRALSNDEEQRLDELRELLYEAHLDTPLVRESSTSARARHERSMQELTTILEQLRGK